jgi:hypothetical protein
MRMKHERHSEDAGVSWLFENCLKPPVFDRNEKIARWIHNVKQTVSLLWRPTIEVVIVV